MRFAFYGRVSTDDAQDSVLSIPRQLAACERAVASVGGEIVACYWDVESGRKNLDKRGNGNGEGLGITVPRDGGLSDLLAASAGTECSLDAVIVESIDRLSRMTTDATHIERELKRRNVGLFASDEPMVANATSLLTRRVKQGIAEWYVTDLVEKSRRGMEQSVLQGWHPGGPAPYGYQLEEHSHPNPHRAREGKKKHRLVPDQVRAPVVRMIFEHYCVAKMGLGEICDKLNGNVVLYPPPGRGGRKGTEPCGTDRSYRRCCATPSTSATTFGVDATSAPVSRRCIRPNSGYGVRPRLTSRSSPASCLTK